MISEMECNDAQQAWQYFLHRVPHDVIGDNCIPAPSLDQRYNTMSMFLCEEKGNVSQAAEYVGNLRDLVDERKTKRNRWNELIDVKGSFEPTVECCRMSVTGPDTVHLRILNVYKWSSCISQMKRGEVYVRTEYKDLHNVKNLSIVNEVWTAGRLIFDIVKNDFEDKVLSVNVNGPVPIAYNTLDFGLHSSGTLEPPAVIEHHEETSITYRKSSKKSLQNIWKKLRRNCNKN